MTLGRRELELPDIVNNAVTVSLHIVVQLSIERLDLIVHPKLAADFGVQYSPRLTSGMANSQDYNRITRASQGPETTWGRPIQAASPAGDSLDTAFEKGKCDSFFCDSQQVSSPDFP